MKRFRWYLKNTEGWKHASSRSTKKAEFLQYAKHPEFTIEETFTNDWQTVEPWIEGIPRLDKKMSSYQIELKVNGVPIYSTNFLALDGWRIFVPIPQIELNDSSRFDFDSKVDKRKFFYDETQIQLAGVIGKLHGDKDIYEFIEKQNIQNTTSPKWYSRFLIIKK